MQQPDTKPLNKYITPLKHTPNMKLKFQTMRTTQSLQTPQLKYDRWPPLDYYILHLMDSPQVGSCTIASCRSPPPSPTMPITTFYIETECAACHCNLKLTNRSEKKGHNTHDTPNTSTDSSPQHILVSVH